MTVEFWIKPTDDSFYVGDTKIIFTMLDTEETLNEIREEKVLNDFGFNLDDANEQAEELREYMKIYLKNNTLVCAPFGNIDSNAI